MKSIIQIDLTTYIIAIMLLLGGNFKELLIMITIILFHELGHIYYLKKYNKKIIKIKIYPFGGVVSYNSLVNHSIKEELRISCAGIVNQLLLYIIFIMLYKFNVINTYTYTLFMNNNTSLIIFNILPIIGLDGGKILKLILELYIPYKYTLSIMIIISFITLFIFTIICLIFNINSIIVLIFLVYKIIYLIKNKKYIINKFYLERIIYNLKYNRIKYVNSINSMYQDTYHFINHNSEKYIIDEYFKI